MPSFVSASDIKVVQDSTWEPWESVTIGKYTQGQKDALERETSEWAGPAGEVLQFRIYGALVPVLMAGIRSWTFRDLSVEAMEKLYAKHAKKNDGRITDEIKEQAVRSIPIAPVDRDHISQLDPVYAVFIATEITAFNRGRTTEGDVSFFREVEDDSGDRGETTPPDNQD